MWDLIIENEDDSAGVLGVIEVLMRHPPLNEQGLQFFKFLAEREEQWEIGRYGEPSATPGTILNEMILSNDYDPTTPALVQIFGSARGCWMATQDQVDITTEQALLLAAFFHTSATLFLKKNTENLDHDSIPDAEPSTNTE